MSDQLMGEEKQKKQTSVSDVAQKGVDTARKVKDTVDKVDKIQKAAKAGKAVGHGSKILTALGPALPYIGIALLVILIIIFLIGIIVFLLTMPGMVMEQLKAMFHKLGNKVAAFFGADTTQQIEDKEIFEVLDYLEDMGYDLKGYGFLTEFYDESDTDIITEAENNSPEDDVGEPDNGVIRSSESGKIIGAKSEVIFTYIMSDNYVYTCKNFNVINGSSNDSGFWKKLWGGIVALGQKVASIFVNEGSLWGKGMIYLENSSGGEWNDGLFDKITIDASTKTMRIRKGWFADEFEYDLEGWTGRYGMPLEFLLSVHIASNMPDLAYDMVSFFGTEVVIRMDDAEAKINAQYRSPNGTNVDYESMWNIKSDGWAITDGWTLSKEEGFKILALGIESSADCEKSFTGPDGTAITCSDAAKLGMDGECCGKCKSHIKSIMGAASKIYDEGIKTYIPYLRKVTDHWYRDVYLELDSGETIDGVEVDEEYEVFMDERWTNYEVYPDTDEFAGNTVWYIIGKDGNFITSDAESARTVTDSTLPMDESKVASGKDGYLYYHVETAKEARDVGLSVARMAITKEYNESEWSAYDPDKESSDSGEWLPAYENPSNDYQKRVYMQVSLTGGKVQIEDGIRGVTNEKIKRIFAVNTYFRYDGNVDTAEIIYALREKLSTDDTKFFGNLNGDKGGDSIYNPSLSKGDPETLASNLEVTADVAVGSDSTSKTYKVKDYSAQLDLTKESLSAFSMLENTHTLDADYIYRDFKELIVELGYFEKEQLTDEAPRLLQFP